MGKARLLYEASFFVLIIYVFVDKFANNSMASKCLLIACGVAVLYEILYILIFHSRDMMSLPRALAIGGVYLSIDALILLMVFAIEVSLRSRASVEAIFSSQQLSAYYDIPNIIDIPSGNLILAIICVVYIIGYAIVSHRLDHKVTF